VSAVIERDPGREEGWLRGPDARGASRLRSADGVVATIDVGRWFSAPSEAEREVLALAVGPVLDIGCGPARHTLALAALGLEALGIDVSVHAIEVARRRRASVARVDVFGEVPRVGAWGSALLLDGNVGIGGDPVRLLSRTRELVRPGGRVLVELEPPGTSTTSFAARIDGASGPWFPWARVGVDDLPSIAVAAGLRAWRSWSAEGRWFARLGA
jgi:SAM-dependent methyltransferase